MGGSIGSERTSSTGRFNNSTTDTLDPRLANTLYGNLDSIRGGGYKPFEGPMVAGFNQDQINAQDQARTAAGANIGGDTLQSAIDAARSGANYTPGQVKGGSYDPFQSSSIGVRRGDIRDVNYGGVDQAGIDRFLNPYTDDVVNSSLSDLDRQRQIAQRDNSAMATKAGAFRGTQLFGLRDNTDDTFARAAGSTAGNLRNQGFQTALGAAQNEAGQQMNASALNQGQDANVASQNANIQLQQAMDMGARADAAKQFGLGQGLNAQQFNVNSGQNAAGVNLAGAGALSSLSNQQRDQAMGNIGLLGGVGDAIQGNTQAGLTAGLDEHLRTQGGALDWAQLFNQGLGLIPQTGTRTQSGTESSRSKGSSVGLSGGYGGK
jgi:hypothetical protein